jgi:hypothetical protein
VNATTFVSARNSHANFHRLATCSEAEAISAGAGRNGVAAPSLPQRINFVWVGGNLPRPVLRRMTTWATLNPEFDVLLWNDDSLAELANDDEIGLLATLCAAARNPAALSDVARFAILQRFGGIYLDADMEACRPVTALVEHEHGFVVRESRSLVQAAALGLPAGSPFARVALRVMELTTAECGELDNFASGPPLVTELCRAYRALGLCGPAVLPEWTFFPENPFRFPRRVRSALPPYGVHLYEHSWGAGSELRLARRVARGLAQSLLPRDAAVGRRMRTQRALRKLATSELKAEAREAVPQ